MNPTPLYVGIDLGTSGCRGLAIDQDLTMVACAEVELPPPRRQGAESEQDAEIW